MYMYDMKWNEIKWCRPYNISLKSVASLTTILNLTLSIKSRNFNLSYFMLISHHDVDNITDDLCINACAIAEQHGLGSDIQRIIPT